MGSKSGSSPFRLKDTDFSCSLGVFAATATASNLQATKFFTLMFEIQKNSVGGGGPDWTQGV